MKKPVKKHHHAKCYSYREIIQYIEDKYSIEVRNYKRDLDDKGGDFWHWMCANNDLHNGCFTYFPQGWDNETTPEWVREIMRLIVREFFPKGEDLAVYCDW